MQERLKREEQERLAAQERKEQEKRDKHAREERARRERIATGKGRFADECVELLPNNLKLFQGWFYFKRTSLDDDEAAEAAVSAIERCFGALGYVDVNYDDKDLAYDFGVEILTTSSLTEKWLLKTDSPLVRAWTLDGVRIERIESPQVSEHFDPRSARTWTFRNIEAPHQGAYKAGDFAHWAEQAQAREEDFEKLNLLIDVCGGDIKAISTVLREKSTEPTPQTWLVPGLIPRGTVTSLLGDKKQGKTAMAQQLSVAYTQREKDWLGFDLDTNRGGFAVYLLGEDSPGEAAKRVKMMTGGELPYLLQIKPADGTEIDDLLSQFASQKIGLLVVDPCRKYHRGNEDSSDTISDLFSKLEAFARAKDCAVLVLHHLKRNARPKNIDEVALYYRGSSVHLDRPRVTLALRRVGNVTEFGIPAPNGVPQHNFLGSEMFSGVKRLRRDEATFRHVAIDDEEKPAGIAVDKRVAVAVLAAVQRLGSQGERVTRSDKRGLYELKPPELIGLPRAKVRAAIDALIADSGLVLDESGALVLPA